MTWEWQPWCQHNVAEDCQDVVVEHDEEDRDPDCQADNNCPDTMSHLLNISLLHTQRLPIYQVLFLSLKR